MKSSRCLLLVLSAVFSFLVGCGGPRPGGVTVAVAAFHPTEAAVAEGRATITLRYTNENISSLGFSGGTHKLYLNGTYVGRADSEQPFAVLPMNTSTQDVVVKLENAALVRQLLGSAAAQTVAYRIESVLRQTIFEDKYEMKSVEQGALDLRAPAEPAK